MRYYLAIDLGASAGRHIVGWKENGTVQTEEVYRFPNRMRKENGHLAWDVEALVSEVKNGIDAALARFPRIHSLAVDTWGVDYVLLCGGTPLLPVYAYRDSRTEAVIPQVHQKLPFSDLYRKTGCQFQPFNTIYQLYDDQLHKRLDRADGLLMLPEYLLYRLCGVKAREYTNATTTGMVNVKTGEFDSEILKTLGYPPELFPKLQKPGEVIGEYRGIRCVLCATHDTASAVEGIPMSENAPYLSSGTWSLLGIKTKTPLTDPKSEATNYSNEGGVGYNRYQKNIMGMWLVDKLKNELCPSARVSEIISAAQGSGFDRIVDANASEFLAPESMKQAFVQATNHACKTVGDYFRCAYRSIAMSYKQALEELEANTATRYDSLYIVGGGAKNDFLNNLTEEMTKKTVIALPIEATALGNLKIQMETDL